MFAGYQLRAVLSFQRSQSLAIGPLPTPSCWELLLPLPPHCISLTTLLPSFCTSKDSWLNWACQDNPGWSLHFKVPNFNHTWKVPFAMQGSIEPSCWCGLHRILSWHRVSHDKEAEHALLYDILHITSMSFALSTQKRILLFSCTDSLLRLFSIKTMYLMLHYNSKRFLIHTKILMAPCDALSKIPTVEG